jgi:hypothetical protein
MPLRFDTQGLGQPLEKVIEANIHFPQNKSGDDTDEDDHADTFVEEESGSEDDVVLNDLAPIYIPAGGNQTTEAVPTNQIPKLNYLGLLASHTEFCLAIANEQKYLASAFLTINMMILCVPQKRCIDATFDIDPQELLVSQDKENRHPQPAISEPNTGAASWMKHMCSSVEIGHNKQRKRKEILLQSNCTLQTKQIFSHLPNHGKEHVDLLEGQSYAKKLPITLLLF